MLTKMINFTGKSYVQFRENGQITLSFFDKIETFNLEDKPKFTNDTGESVIELSGLATLDQRNDRSWAVASYEQGGYSELHYHKERTENYYITQGNALVIIDHEMYFLSQGESITITAGKIHQVFSVGTEKLELIVHCSPSWIIEDRHFINLNAEKPPLMDYHKAEAARKKFLAMHPDFNNDDNSINHFYAEVDERLHLSQLKITKKLIFIIVAHRVHTLPYFIEAVTRLGSVAAIIPKSSYCVPEVMQSLSEIYKDYWHATLDKTALNTNAACVKQFFINLIKLYPEYNFMILDHGGYFAPCLDLLCLLGNKLAGIVEHTWNGEIRYDKSRKISKILNEPIDVNNNNVLKKKSEKEDINNNKKVTNSLSYPFPLYSIARSRLKAREDEHVADSIVSTLKTTVFGGEGLNHSFDEIGDIGIIGYGHIGQKVALNLRYVTRNRNKIRVYDLDESARSQAMSDGFESIENKTDLLIHSHLIITATSSHALTKEDFLILQNGVCITCVTSSDDQFKSEAYADFEVSKEAKAKAVTFYKHKKTGKMFALAANGGSINFLMGSTPHSILHAVLASVCVSVLHCNNPQENLENTNSFIKSISEVEMHKIESIYNVIFGSSISYTKTYGVYNSMRYFFGREIELQKLERSLHHEQMGVISQSIVGIGGIGKTALARAYVARALEKKTYDYILTFDASTEHNLYKDFKKLAQKLGISLLSKQNKPKRPSYLIPEIYHALEHYSQILLIFDNAPKYDSLQRAYIQQELVNFLPPKVAGQIVHWIVTTQNNNLKAESVISLGLLEDKASIQLIGHYLPGTSNEEAYLLAKTLNFFPLALCQAVAYLQQTKTDINAYVQHFKATIKRQRNFLATQEFAPADHYYTVYATWDIALSTMMQRHGSKPEQLLNMLAYLAAEKIPLSLIANMIPAIYSDIVKLNMELDILQKYSFVELQMQQENAFLLMHPLLQAVARLRQDEKQISGVALRSIWQVVDKCMGDKTQFHLFFQHALSVIEHHDKYLSSENGVEKFNLLVEIATFQHFSLLSSKKAYQTYRLAKSIYDRVNDDRIISIAKFFELQWGLANSASAMGNPLDYVKEFDIFINSDKLTAENVIQGLKYLNVPVDNPQYLEQLKKDVPQLASFLMSFGNDITKAINTVLQLPKPMRKELLLSALVELDGFDLVTVYRIYEGRLKEAHDITINARHKFASSDTDKPERKLAANYLYVLTYLLYYGEISTDAEILLNDAYKLAYIPNNERSFWSDQLQFLRGLVYVARGNVSLGTQIHFGIWQELENSTEILSGEKGIRRRTIVIKKIIEFIENVQNFPKNKATDILAHAYRILGRYFSAFSVQENNSKNLSKPKLSTDTLAEECFTKSLAYNESCAITYYERGCMYLRKQNYREAFNDFSMVMPLLDEDQNQTYWYASKELRGLPKFVRNTLFERQDVTQQELPLRFWIYLFLAYNYYKKMKKEKASDYLDRIKKEITLQGVMKLIATSLENKIQAMGLTDFFAMRKDKSKMQNNQNTIDPFDDRHQSSGSSPSQE